jgi:hypothetical protein
MIQSKRVGRSAGVAAVMGCFLLLGACDDDSQSISVGGSVSGLATGTTVSLTNNGGSTLSVSANGTFTFPTPVPQNGSYNVTVATQPKGQICTVSSASGNHLVSSVTNVGVACATENLTISGSVSGLPSGAKLVLEDNGVDILTLSANAAFSFAAPVNYNSVYAVTVVSQPTGATCTVSNGIGAGVTAAVTNVTVACSTKTYPVSGALSGLASGAHLVLQNNGADALSLSANGAFKFAIPVAFDGSYAVTVSTSPTQATCSVMHGVGAGVTAAVTGVSVLCSADTYTISGTVSGLAAGSQVTLDDNAADALTVTANGVFTFATPVVAGGSYAVTVGTQPTGETCTVSGGQGSLLGGNVSNVSVICATSTFTIGGTLSGLVTGAGIQVTLDNNGADPLTLTTNGAFTFATPVAYGGAYNVTVGTQPGAQQCVITNATGTNVSSNITSVSAECQTTVSYTTPGTYTLTVPAGVISVQVVAIGGGAGGSGESFGLGSPGGSGAQVTATLSVTAGQAIGLVVGGGGISGLSPGGGICPSGGGGGGASSIDAGNADQVIAGGGGGGDGCGSDGYNGGTGGGANGAGGAGAGVYGGAGGSGGIGGAAGSSSLGMAGGNGDGGPGGAGGSNGPYLGGNGGSGVGGGAGGNADLTAGGGGGGYGGGAAYEAGGGAGGSIGPSGTDYSAASNAGAVATNGGDGSITFILQ